MSDALKTEPTGLTTEQLLEFETSGVLALPGAVEADAIEKMRSQTWELLEQKEGIRAADPSTWRAIGASCFRPLSDVGAFDPMASRRVRAALDDLLGKGCWQEPAHWGQMLFTLPGGQSWTLPHQSWHLDLPPGRIPVAGVQLFVMVEHVSPGGGGTLAASGTHRLVEQLQRDQPERVNHSADIRKTLQRSVPWLEDLLTPDDSVERAARFMADPHDFEGVPLRVVEMTGEPGDAVAMHPWVFHAPAPNCREGARIMLAERIQRHPK